jgi:regulator of cell morphogenesis and NO signaling
VDTHHRYLREVLPFLVPLSAKVARVHGHRHPNVRAVYELTVELGDALLPHLEREEQVLFPALLTAGEHSPVVRAELDSMQAEHLEVGALLEQLRTAAGDFKLPEDACASYSTLFRELEALEADVLRHVHLENHVLMPRFSGSSLDRERRP